MDADIKHLTLCQRQANFCSTTQLWDSKVYLCNFHNSSLEKHCLPSRAVDRNDRKWYGVRI